MHLSKELGNAFERHVHTKVHSTNPVHHPSASIYFILVFALYSWAPRWGMLDRYEVARLKKAQ